MCTAERIRPKTADAILSHYCSLYILIGGTSTLSRQCLSAGKPVRYCKTHVALDTVVVSEYPDCPVRAVLQTLVCPGAGHKAVVICPKIAWPD